MRHALRESSVQRAIVIVFAVITAIYNACVPLADNDLWGHVYFGREILAKGSLPLTNLYAYTAPNHPWINHETLAECAFALAFDAFGPGGLLVLKLAIGLATVGLLTWTILRRAHSLAAAAVALVISGSLLSPGFLVRPQIFTFLALAWLWNRLDAYDERRDWRSLATLPVLFVLWTNTHGGVAAGLGIFLAYVGSCWFSRTRRDERPRLALIALLSTLALLANPYGAGLPIFLFRDLLRERAITEWLPIAPFAFTSLILEGTLALLVAGTLAGLRKRAWEIAILAAAALMTFRHQRHLPLFAILAAPRVAESLETLWQWIRYRFRVAPLTPITHSLIAAGICGIAVFEIVRVQVIFREIGLQIFVSPELYPVDAVRFIKRNRLSGNLAVPSDWGEYAIWHLYPDCPVSVDGRYTTAYPDDVLDLSERFQFGLPGWEGFLRGADLALVDRRQPIVPQMLRAPDWRYVYSDPTALLFIRAGLFENRTFVREPRSASDRAFFFP